MPNETPPQPRVVGAYAQTAVDTALAAGADADAIATLLGVTAAQVGALPESIPAVRYAELLRQATVLTGDADFGLHVGERMTLATFSVYGMVVMSCRTFGEAMAQVMRFESLAHDLGRSALQLDGGVARYEWHSPDFAGSSRHLSESVFSGIACFTRWLAKRDLPIIEIGFPHPAPVEMAEYQRIFGAPVRFDAPIAYACFYAAMLEWALPNADSSLFDLLTQHAEALLAARRREHAELPILSETRQAIVMLLAHDGATLARVAGALSLTPRTLQRRLSEAGTSFQQVLDSTRKALAADYIGEASMSLTDIAFLLGFSEQSSFSHAFRDWYGQSPASYRSAKIRA
ncbi:MAG: AraC family transcriptional regulator [Burkholderiales bacterium]|nr:AraC family transcriptional regulator [Burkholderiales bacterium]